MGCLFVGMMEVAMDRPWQMSVSVYMLFTTIIIQTMHVLVAWVKIRLSAFTNRLGGHLDWSKKTQRASPYIYVNNKLILSNAFNHKERP